jgi:hypothetical protein
VHDLFTDPFAQSPLTQLFKILDQHKRCACQPAHLGLRIATPQTERWTTSLVYLISGAGDPSENARSNEARSSEEMSETAM